MMRWARVREKLKLGLQLRVPYRPTCPCPPGLILMPKVRQIESFERRCPAPGQWGLRAMLSSYRVLPSPRPGAQYKLYIALSALYASGSMAYSRWSTGTCCHVAMVPDSS